MQAPTNKLIYILHSATYGDRTVKPLGESTFRINYELQNEDTNPRYGYDIKFSGNLIFTGEDFDWLLIAENSGNRCEDMFIELQHNGCGSGFEEIIAGTKINLAQGTWDLDKCRLTIPVVTTDPYECINDKKGDDLNMFDCGGAVQSVNLYDYVPVFEYSYMPFDSAPGMDFSTQNFAHYPNGRAQYPGFSCEGQFADPYWPESATTLFTSADLTHLERSATTFEEYLTTGSIPMHIDYPIYSGANDAVNDGWRLYYFKYEIDANQSGPNLMNYKARYRWVREIKDVTIGTPMPTEWVFVGVVGGLDRWARPPVLMPRTNVYKPSYTWDAFPGERIITMEATTYIVGATTNIVNQYDDNDEINAGASNGNVYGFDALPNGYLLNDVIEYSVAEMCPGLTVKSEFLQINPDTVTGTNYVTGTASDVDNIVIFQKSDVKRPWASEKATIGRYTWAELSQWLWDMMQLKYCIMGNVLRIEHISSPILRKAATIDLTIAPFNKMLDRTRVYSYETDKLQAKETFAFMEARKQVTFGPTDDFAGMPITYDGNCVNRKEKQNVLDRKVARVTTDVLFVLINSGGFSELIDNATQQKYTVNTDVDNGVIDDDGFVLMASQVVSAVRYGKRKTTILDTVDRINNVLGWAYLHDAFYRTDRNAKSGVLNGNPVTFASTKYIKKQITLPFKQCCIAGFDPYELITGAFGDGLIKSAEWSPTDQIMAVELLYQI